MIRPECYRRLVDGWERPTPDEIAELLGQHGVTPYRVAQLLGVYRSTVKRWLEGTPIRYADWRALVWELEQEQERR